jgi:large subunit ribosomal protein L25
VGEHQLEVEVREGRGKGVARKLRADGRIPGVCYGRDTDTVAISLDARALARLLAISDAGMNTLIDLRGRGLDGKTVLVKELQRDPVDGQPLHADFYAVDLARTVEVSVPVHLIGRAPGVEMGGILDHSLREIELECLPTAIPKELTLDVGALEMGDTVHVRDIPLPEGVELLSDADLSVVSVVAPAVVEEAAPAEAVEEGVEVAEGAPAEGEEGEKKEEGEKPAEEGASE